MLATWQANSGENFLPATWQAKSGEFLWLYLAHGIKEDKIGIGTWRIKNNRIRIGMWRSDNGMGTWKKKTEWVLTWERRKKKGEQSEKGRRSGSRGGGRGSEGSEKVAGSRRKKKRKKSLERYIYISAFWCWVPLVCLYVCDFWRNVCY